MRRPDHARRHRDDAARPPRRRAHRPTDAGTRLDVGRGGARIGGPGCDGIGVTHRRSIPHRRIARQRTGFHLLAGRRGLGRGDHRGHQPDPRPGRDGGRHPARRLSADRHRQRTHTAAARPGHRSGRRPIPGSRQSGVHPAARRAPHRAGRRAPTSARNRFSCCCSRPAPPGRPRRSGAARAGWPASPTPRSPSTATSATTSTTAACRCSTATRSWRCGPRPWRSARRSA